MDTDACRNNGKDPVDEFFRAAKRPTVASVIVDSMAADVQAAADAMVAAPLDFDMGPQKEIAGPEMQPDAFSPTLAAVPPCKWSVQPLHPHARVHAGGAAGRGDQPRLPTGDRRR